MLCSLSILLAAPLASPLPGEGRPAPQRWKRHRIDASVHSYQLRTADLDGDGDPDVLNPGGWYENVPGNAGDWPHRYVDFGVGLEPADVDGDGDLDVFGFHSGALLWNENLAGDGSSWLHRPISSGHFDADLLDVDGDGDPDVLASDTAELSWIENAGGGLAWTEHLVGAADDTVYYVHGADVDADGDPDLVLVDAEPLGSGRVVWFENEPGTLPWPRREGSLAYGSSHAIPVDLDRDRDADLILVHSAVGACLDWHENLGGGEAWKVHCLRRETAFQAAFADLDGDGDTDVVYPRYSRLSWLQNPARRGQRADAEPVPGR